MFNLFKKKKEATNETTMPKFIITPPANPIPEVQTEAGVKKYVSKITKLTRSDLCIELSNVMAAKYNIMNGYTGPGDSVESQSVVNDLNDKVALILMFEFGQETVLRYGGGNLREFNALVRDLDEEVAELNLDTKRHGELLLSKLSEHL